jgi:hypothetical protein
LFKKIIQFQIGYEDDNVDKRNGLDVKEFLSDLKQIQKEVKHVVSIIKVTELKLKVKILIFQMTDSN